MSPFGWGVLLGGLGAAFVLALAHVGRGWAAVLAAVAWAVVLTIIPNHWVGMGRKRS